MDGVRRSIEELKPPTEEEKATRGARDPREARGRLSSDKSEAPYGAPEAGSWRILIPTSEAPR